MTLFEVYICILGTIYVIDKIIDTLLNIIVMGENGVGHNINPEHIKSMYS